MQIIIEEKNKDKRYNFVYPQSSDFSNGEIEKEDIDTYLNIKLFK